VVYTFLLFLFKVDVLKDKADIDESRFDPVVSHLTQENSDIQFCLAGTAMKDASRRSQLVHLAPQAQ